MRTDAMPRRQRGLTLIELILFIVIVGVGVAGITVTYNTVVRHSADPMVRKQAIAIAESLLLEIEQQAFTWCDPQDANVLSATSFAGCAANNQSGLAGPTPGTETRGSNANPFDNVADYGNYNTVINGYTASVAITQAGGVAPFAALPADAVLRIAVTVARGDETVTLVGYRSRYAPRAPG